MADSGAEIPNQRTTIRSIVARCGDLLSAREQNLIKTNDVLNGTAPEEPAIIRNRLRRNTIININLANLK